MSLDGDSAGGRRTRVAVLGVDHVERRARRQLVLEPEPLALHVHLAPERRVAVGGAELDPRHLARAAAVVLARVVRRHGVLHLSGWSVVSAVS